MKYPLISKNNRQIYIYIFFYHSVHLYIYISFIIVFNQEISEIELRNALFLLFIIELLSIRVPLVSCQTLIMLLLSCSDSFK